MHQCGKGLGLLCCDPSTQKAEVGDLPLQGKSRLHSETLPAKHVVNYIGCESTGYSAEKHKIGRRLRVEEV